jgi:hypothetical protein
MHCDSVRRFGFLTSYSQVGMRCYGGSPARRDLLVGVAPLAAGTKNWRRHRTDRKVLPIVCVCGRTFFCAIVSELRSYGKADIGRRFLLTSLTHRR